MAIHDPVALLKRLGREGKEKPWLEFKVNQESPDELGEYISALANGAIISGAERAFMVFGVEDDTMRHVGTNVRLETKKVG